MSDNLTTLIAKVQNLLGDASGTYFTAALCTAALRQALAEWNMRAPLQAALLKTGVNNQYEYEVTDEDVNAIELTDILRQGDDSAADENISLTYDEYIEDERLFFRLRAPVTTSDTLIIRYQKDHTIDGLDSATDSTLPARYDQAIVCGGAFFAIMIRAVSKVETINLSQQQSDNYRELAPTWAAYFVQRLMQASKRKPPVGEPDTRAWTDDYSREHGWEQ